MIFTVTLHPALDKVSVVRDFEVDGVGMTERSRQSPGGQGIQISSVLQVLGARTVAMGLIGGAAGDWIRDQLDLLGVPNDFTFTANETRINLTILDPDNDTCTRILEPGQPVTAENLQELWGKAGGTGPDWGYGGLCREESSRCHRPSAGRLDYNPPGPGYSDGLGYDGHGHENRCGRRSHGHPA